MPLQGRRSKDGDGPRRGRWRLLVVASAVAALTIAVAAIALAKTSTSGPANSSAAGVGPPVPPPPDDPPPAGGSLLFNGDFDTGDTSQWTGVQEEGGMVTILPTTWGPIGRFELDDPGDVRAEVYRDLVMRRGDDRWFRWQTAFDPRFPGEDDWHVIWQLHQDGNRGGPPLALEIGGRRAPGRFFLHGNGMHHGRRDGPYYWLGPRIKPARWYDLMIHVNHSPNPRKGFVEVWLNGEKQTLGNRRTRMRGPTLYDRYNYPKLGYYRSSDASRSGVVYHDGYVIGSSRSAVE